MDGCRSAGVWTDWAPPDAPAWFHSGYRRSGLRMSFNPL